METIDHSKKHRWKLVNAEKFCNSTVEIYYDGFFYISEVKPDKDYADHMASTSLKQMKHLVRENLAKYGQKERMKWEQIL